MAYVPVPKDLTKVKTKVAFNLTKRPLVCFGCGALIGVPVSYTHLDVYKRQSESCLQSSDLLERA